MQQQKLQVSTLKTLCVALMLVALVKFDAKLGVEARDKGGDDIILTKGKIIMRGGKGKGK